MAHNGLTADVANLAIRENGNIPETLECKGDTEEIFRGSVLSWNTTTNDNVAKQVPSIAAFHAPVGIALKGTDADEGLVQVQKRCTVENLIIYGSPEVGTLAYLRGRLNKLTDQMSEHSIPRKLLRGKCIFTNAAATVVGEGTQFLTDIAVGDMLYDDTEGYAYRQVVLSITNDELLTLTTVFGGTGAVTAVDAYKFTPVTRAMTIGTSITLTNPSQDITGVGTKFTEECNVGDWIYIIDAGVANSGLAYKGTIETIVDDETMTIGANYTGDTSAATGTAFGYIIAYSEVTTEPYELWDTTYYYNLPLGKITNFKNTLWTIDFDPNVAGDLAIGSGAALVSSSLDTAAAGTLAIGAITANLLTLSRTGIATTVLGTFDVNEAVTLDQVTIVTDDGDFSVSGSEKITLATTKSAADAITLTTNGGVLEQMVFTNTQGTNAASIDFNSTVGGYTLDVALGISLDGLTASNFTVTGASEDLTLASVGGSVNIEASEADADAIVIEATNAAGGLKLSCGTAGMVFDSPVPVVGTGLAGAGYATWIPFGKRATTWYNEFIIDITALRNSGVQNDIIGDNDAANCHFGQITAGVHGTVSLIEITCIEAPTTGDADIDFYSAQEGTGTENTLVTDLTETLLLEATENWTLGMSKTTTVNPAADEYLYMVDGAAAGGDVAYATGKFLIRFYGT